jgi:hypothetical protein
MEIIVKREDIPGGIKFTTKDCEYPRHFASTIRQALLLDGLDENTIDAIFGISRDKVCVAYEGKLVSPDQQYPQDLMDTATLLGLMPIGKPIEEKEEWEVSKSILTVDCEALSELAKEDWYKSLVKEMESTALDGRLIIVYGAERTGIYNKERGLVIEPAGHNVYGVAPLETCNSLPAMDGDDRFKIFESLADAINFAG